MHDTEMRDIEHHDPAQRNRGVPSRWVRNLRGAPRWGLLIGVAVVVLAAGLLAGIWGTSNNSNKASGHDNNQADRAANSVADAFTFLNDSTYTLRYDGYQPTHDVVVRGGPDTGTTIAPGTSLGFDQTYFVDSEQGSELDLNFTDTYTSATLTLGLTIDMHGSIVDDGADVSSPTDLTTFWDPHHGPDGEDQLFVEDTSCYEHGQNCGPPIQGAARAPSGHSARR